MSEIDETPVSGISEALTSNVEVTPLEFQGPSIYEPGPGSSKRMEYSGYQVRKGDERTVVVRGPLSGATLVMRYDVEGNEVGSDTLYGPTAELILDLNEKLEPETVSEALDIVGPNIQKEKEAQRARIEEAGGRDNYLLVESKKLVEAGAYGSINEARMALIMQMEVNPSYPVLEGVLRKIVETGEVEPVTPSSDTTTA